MKFKHASVFMVALLASTPLAAQAAGLLTNGLSVDPVVTGSEQFPVDNQLPNGAAPQSPYLSVKQLMVPSITTATNTTAFTATVAQTVPLGSGSPWAVNLQLTGALGAGANVTLPTAAAMYAAYPQPFPTCGGSTGISCPAWVLKLSNESSGAFAWTAVTNTGLTLTGSMIVPQNGSRQLLITLTSPTAATVQDLGN